MDSDLEVSNPLTDPQWEDRLISSSTLITHFSIRHSGREYGVNPNEYNPLYFARRAKGKFERLIPVMEIHSKLNRS